MSLDISDPGFVDDLRASEPAIWRVAMWLRASRGIPVTVRPTFVRDRPENRSEYSDFGDIEIVQRVEVKHRKLAFSSLETYPYPTAIVDVAHAWDRARPKPYAYVLLNEDMTGALIVDALKTSKHWSLTTRMDKKCGRVRDFYECPLRLCSFEALGDV